MLCGKARRFSALLVRLMGNESTITTTTAQGSDHHGGEESRQSPPPRRRRGRSRSRSRTPIRCHWTPPPAPPGSAQRTTLSFTPPAPVMAPPVGPPLGPQPKKAPKALRAVQLAGSGADDNAGDVGGTGSGGTGSGGTGNGVWPCSLVGAGGIVKQLDSDSPIKKPGRFGGQAPPVKKEEQRSRRKASLVQGRRDGDLEGIAAKME